MRLLLVDGHYFLYRSFFAIRGLTNSRGEPTNAIYGFVKALRKMIADVKPDLGAVIWDCGLPERRTQLQPEYKQNRPSMPDEMRSQEHWLQEHIALFGPASLSLPNTEADDLIASYARAAVREGVDVVVATNDKDILQIVSPSILIYSTNKADAGTAGFALLGEDAVRAKWGVDPARIAEVLALTGDTSDNIPGVPGVGEKTAAQLIRQFGTVENLLNRAGEIPSAKVREKILAARDLILANRRMVALDDDLALPQPLTALALRPDYPALIEAIKACEFKSLLKEIEAEAQARTTPTQGELL
jgi:5''-3'' exonuclease (including N-terminal domain of PolI)